jgi:hypothetical protein
MMFEMFKKGEPLIEFACVKEDWEAIPAPYPAKQYIPQWFKALAPKTFEGLTGGTVKRCPPFLDAMTAGWIIPLAADAEVISNSDASGVEYRWNFYKNVIENHSVEQITSDKAPNPRMPKPPMKWMNYWKIKVPKGYSCLFVPPLNRPDPRFECLSGIVDCDGYHEYINFPFFFNKPNFTGVIEAGTPLIQVIPFKRDSAISDSVIRAFTEQDVKEMALTRRKRSSHESHYRDHIWVKRKTTR